MGTEISESSYTHIHLLCYPTLYTQTPQSLIFFDFQSFSEHVGSFGVWFWFKTLIVTVV